MDDKTVERLVNLIARTIECKDCPCAMHKKGKPPVCGNPLYCSDILAAWVTRRD